MNTVWGDYVRRVTAGLSQKDISERTGLDPSAISRWLRSLNEPRAEKAVAFARQMGASPIEALVAAGYITRSEAGATIRTPISDYTEVELLDELKRRVVPRFSSRTEALANEVK
jgi:transcriptional regulator with XRE-family HTH domain